MEFEYKNLLKLRKMTLEELENYYKELRKYEFANNKEIKGIELRKKINQSFMLLLKLNRLLSRQKLTVLKDDRLKTDKPKIFAVTHIGRYDIEIGMEVINESNYLLMGDPGETYRDLDGLILSLKGILFVDTSDKEDRTIAKETCIKILNKGGNIMIFPEGAWNITDNQVVMKLFEGAVDMARKTGAEIIPIAIEQYDKDYYAMVGKNMTIDDKKNNRDYSDDLRDIMATLRWNIWENFPIEMREELSDECKKEYIDKIMSETENGYTIEEINKTRYNDASIVSADEVFKFKENLEPNLDNAFLFRNKR